MSDLKIAVMGAAGRMGRELIATIHAQNGCVVAGGAEPEGSQALGRDLGELAGVGTLGVTVTSDAAALMTEVDAIVDFTSPAASVAFAAMAADAGIIHIIGTTGFEEEHEAAIAKAAKNATIVKAGNMSLGVNLIVEMTRKIAEALDEDFDIEVLEMHHKHKVDAPSGTALMLGQAAAEGRGVDLKARSVRVRDGMTGARKAGDIGFATLRGGSVVGEHSVIFAGQGERVVISHVATDRGIFARGAVKAALWARDREPGLYAMKHVLGL
ncbi:MAG: 4-hydroxy-tetrahydrodipicolinate reductase [Alphaproteobacteria bacterium]|nr:4-hydroxy-tetrahydrodipicolinate reductase [Alphaproteobacteria bacterium]